MGRIATLLKIYPGEPRLVGLLISVFFLTSIGAAVGSPAVEGLFYARFGVEFLPYMYIALGVTTMAVSLVLAGLFGRLSKKRLYLSLPLLFAAVMGLSRVLVGMDLNWFYPVLWLWAYLMWTLQAYFVWGLAALLCNTRQAKRLFPLFGAGGILGIALGGMVTPALVAWVGAANLLLVWGLALLGAFVVAVVLIGGYREPKRPSWRLPPALLAEVQKGYHYVQRTNLMRWIALAAAFFSVLFFSLLFPFSKAIAARFPDEDSIASFIGVLQGSITVTAFVISILVANRFFARFGLINAILVFPLIYLFGFAAAILTGAAFTALVVFRFVQMVWRQAFADSAFQSIFNIVPESHREQTLTFIRGVPEQIGLIMTGLIMAVGATILTDQHLFAIGLVAAVITAAAVWRARGAYRRALIDALRAGQPIMFYSQEEPFGGFRQDAAAVDAVVAGIGDPDPSMRKISAEILGHLAVPRATQSLIEVLEDFDEDVRATTLMALARAGESSTLLEVAASLEDPSPKVRLQAVDALARLASHPRGIRLHLSPLLQDFDPQVRARAAVVLLRTGAHPLAADVIQRMSESDRVAERVAGLGALAAWGDVSGYQLAARALYDPVPSVKKAAISAISTLDPASCQTALIDMLADADSSVREAAAAAIGKLGPDVLPGIFEALKVPEREQGALLSLHHLPVGRVSEALHNYLIEKVRVAGHYDRLLRGVQPYRDQNRYLHFLSGALDGSVRYHAVSALKAVGLMGDPGEMQITIENLANSNSGQRANALEMLDSLPQRDLILPIMKILESDLRSGDVPASGDPQVLYDSLKQILLDSDNWLLCCGILACIGIDDAEVRSTLVRSSKDRTDPLVLETAEYVLLGAAMDTLSTLPIMERIPCVELKHLCFIK